MDTVKGALTAVDDDGVKHVIHSETSSDMIVDLPEVLANTIVDMTESGGTITVTKSDGSTFNVELTTAPAAGEESGVTGVKGDTETSYRTGDVNLTAADVGAAAKTHSHAASDINSGTLPVARGGTGQTTLSNVTVGSANKLSTARMINGVPFDGSAAALFGGYCSTSAATAAKTVSISNYSLTAYSVIYVMFRYVNTAENPTLNVNGTGDYPIKVNNAARTKVTWSVYQPVFFMYYSSAWHIVDPCVNPETIARLSASGETITYTKGDGTTNDIKVTWKTMSKANVGQLITPGRYFVSDPTNGPVNKSLWVETLRYTYYSYGEYIIQFAIGRAFSHPGEKSMVFFRCADVYDLSLNTGIADELRTTTLTNAAWYQLDFSKL